MSVRSVELATGWTVSLVQAPGSLPELTLPESIPAVVPGVIHQHLLDADLVPHPYLDDNEHVLGWIGESTWTYRVEFQALAGCARHSLVFEGLDTVAEVQVNGTEVLRSYNQHRTYEVDVTHVVLRDAPNVLEIRFEPALAYAFEQERKLGARPHSNTYPFNAIRKMAANFGWDWGPALITAGIWRPVRLVGWKDARIRRTHVVPSVVGGKGRLEVSAVVEACSDDSWFVRVKVDGAETSAAVVDGAARVEFDVEDPRLWWPRGLGSQEFYEVEMELVAAEGWVVDSVRRQFGFRHVELDTDSDEAGSAFALKVNGRSVFVRGANWIPDDCFPGSIPRERYEERIDQSIDAGVNLLRVWGGGTYESDEFYELCDSKGILVWQDFLFACAAYSEESPLWEEVRGEAEDNIVRLSPHPALVLWNGCNENIWGWFDWDWQEPLAGQTWGLGYYLRLLPELVGTLAPHTPYWPGSPYSGQMSIPANTPGYGNTHLWDVWNRADYRTYSAYRPRFVSEFGYQGPPAWSTLTKWVHDDPLTDDSPNLLVHQKAPNGVQKIRRGMEPHLRAPRDFEDWHYLAQLQQARAIEFGIRHFRSLQPYCMGVIIWQINDCWPVVSWSMVDWSGSPKPAWHALRRAYKDRIVSVDQSGARTHLTLVNSGVDAWQERLTAQRIDISGRVLGSYSFDADVAPGSVVQLALPRSVADPTEPTKEILRVTDESSLSLLDWIWVEERDLELLPARVEVEVSAPVDGRQTIFARTDVVARGFTVFPDRVESSARVEDSDITLIPGITTKIELRSPRGVATDELLVPGVVKWLNMIIE